MADGSNQRLFEKHHGGVTDWMRLMAGDALERHITVVGVIVKRSRTRLRLPAIGVTLEAGTVTQRKAQMIGLFEIADEVLHGVPAGYGFDDEFVGVGRPDVAIDAFDFAFMKMRSGHRHETWHIGHEILEDILV
jgi:hypothetical protein